MTSAAVTTLEKRRTPRRTSPPARNTEIRLTSTAIANTRVNAKSPKDQLVRLPMREIRSSVLRMKITTKAIRLRTAISGQIRIAHSAGRRRLRLSPPRIHDRNHREQDESRQSNFSDCKPIHTRSHHEGDRGSAWHR